MQCQGARASLLSFPEDENETDILRIGAIAVVLDCCSQVWLLLRLFLLAVPQEARLVCGDSRGSDLGFQVGRQG